MSEALFVVSLLRNVQLVSLLYLPEHLEIVHATLDGVDPRKVALITEDTTLTGFITFTNGLDINGSLTVNGLVNGCDLYDLYVNGIRLHGVSPQVIDGNKIIDELAVVQPGDISLLPNKTVNGIEVSELGKAVLMKNESQNATGEFQFNNLNVQNLIVTDLLNGKNLTFIFGDAVFVDENQVSYFSELVVFHRVVDTTNNRSNGATDTHVSIKRNVRHFPIWQKLTLRLQHVVMEID